MKEDINIKESNKKKDKEICIIEVNKNILNVKNGLPLTLPLRELNKNCKFQKEWENRCRLEEGKTLEERKADRRWREENKDKINKYHKTYYEKNKEKIIEYIKKYNKEHREEMNKKRAEYWNKNKDRLNENRRIARKKKKVGKI